MTEAAVTIELTGNARDRAIFESYLEDEGLEVTVLQRALESRGAQQMAEIAIYSVVGAATYDGLKAAVIRAIAKLRERSPHVETVVGPDDLLPHRRADRTRQ